MFSRCAVRKLFIFTITKIALGAALLLIFSINVPKKPERSYLNTTENQSLLQTNNSHLTHRQGPKSSMNTGSIACYRLKENSLVDISDTTPRLGKSIFFHETSCSSYKNGKIIISFRQACTVESAALMNQDFDVYLLYTSPGQIKNENTTSDKLFKVLSTYKNVNIRHLDYDRYIRNTPLEKFYKSEKIELLKYADTHVNNMLRYLTLWKYGGIYLDLDSMVLKPLNMLFENYAGSQSDELVGAGILNFAHTGKGHGFAKKCVEDLIKHFKRNISENSAPEVITRVLRNISSVKTVNKMLQATWSGFQVYPSETFYPVPYIKWETYFDPQYNKTIFEIVNNSYVAYMWNNVSQNKQINIKLDVPYTILAKKYCPKVFSECKDFF